MQNLNILVYFLSYLLVIIAQLYKENENHKRIQHQHVDACKEAIEHKQQWFEAESANLQGDVVRLEQRGCRYRNEESPKK